ncbi:MAG: CDP-glycerol glycerophosphotransferase family protein [Frankiales bacterium]|nr:CDP-glycerol glycerophosphotransferase family protein [Frankiales bacterium]
MTRPPRPADLAGGAALAVTLLGAFVAAATGSRWGVAGVLALAAIVELAVRRGATADLLGAVGGSAPATAAARLLPIVAVAGRAGAERSVLIAVITTAGLLLALAFAADLGRSVAARLRQLPLTARNLDLGDARLPSAPPRLLVGRSGAVLAAEPLLAIGLAAARGRYNGWLEAGLGIAVLLAALPVVLLGVDGWRLLRGGARDRVVTAIRDAVERLRPDVVLYFAGVAAEVYQPDMWLSPVAALARPALVLVRDRGAFAALGATGLPVVCAPYNGTVAALPLPAPTVTLFVTHSGNNLAMLRRPETVTAFVGHGDSDKPDSVNPYARVYDQVWVAGPLGRRRYAEAAVGVADDAVVEIGRPQLTDLVNRARELGPPGQPTVLYAPTWEGWGDDPHHSSLPYVGPALIRRLLAEPGLRVVYRPHPLTGRRDPRLRAAHREIERLLRDAGVPPCPPELADCLATASALVADVSSVVSEYLALDRPYAVVDTRGLGDEEFRRRYAGARGGFVLGPDLEALPALLAAAAGKGDVTDADRHRLRADSLGDQERAQQLFAQAVSALQMGQIHR